jgi:hypothetical protein
MHVKVPEQNENALHIQLACMHAYGYSEYVHMSACCEKQLMNENNVAMTKCMGGWRCVCLCACVGTCACVYARMAVRRCS